MIGEKTERLCRRCGRCCYKKFVVNNVVYQTSLPCEYLDESGKQCTVYEQRHEVCPSCLDVPTGIEMGVLPADCPYVQGIPDYVPPVEDWGFEDLGEAAAEIAGELGASPARMAQLRAGVSRGPAGTAGSGKGAGR